MQIEIVEKVDSPIGDENTTFHFFPRVQTCRESRFPDRGRKLHLARAITVLLSCVEKVDSPIGDENSIIACEQKFFIKPVEKVDSPIGDENYSTSSPKNSLYIEVEKVDSPIGDENGLICAPCLEST